MSEESRKKGPKMTATLAPSYAPDNVVTLHVVSDALGHYLEMVGGVVEGNPLLKCGADGRLTLVSPGKTHEQADRRLGMLVVAVCSVLEIPFSADGSTLYSVPGTGRGYVPDESYYIQHHDEVAAGTTSQIPPDLVIEIVVSHPAEDALTDCALLGVPEVWVWDVPRGTLEFHLLATRGKYKGRYVSNTRSGVLPVLDAGAVFERLVDPTSDAGQFDRNCRAWAEQVLAPPRGLEGGR
jgi:Uma2 family endonuclease